MTPQDSQTLTADVALSEQKVRDMLDWLERTTDERNFPAHLLAWAHEAEEWLRAALNQGQG